MRPTPCASCGEAPEETERPWLNDRDLNVKFQGILSGARQGRPRLRSAAVKSAGTRRSKVPAAGRCRASHCAAGGWHRSVTPARARSIRACRVFRRRVIATPPRQREGMSGEAVSEDKPKPKWNVCADCSSCNKAFPVIPCPAPPEPAFSGTHDFVFPYVRCPHCGSTDSYSVRKMKRRPAD
jgi:hypothetical protein